MIGNRNTLLGSAEGRNSCNFYLFFKTLLSCIVVFGMIHSAASLTCPQKRPMENFNITRYLATYYEIYSYGNDNFTTFHRCPTESFFSYNNEYSLYGSVLSFLDKERFNWTADFNMTTPGIFNATQYMYEDVYHFDLIVLGTDYKNWIVLWSCPFISGKEAAWIMTKNPILVNETLPVQQREEISRVLLKNGIPWTRFQRSSNYDCDD